MDLVIRSFSFERQARIFNYSPTSTTPDPGAEADLGVSSAIFGGFTEPADPNLHNQYLNEALLGYEREVLPDARRRRQGDLPRLRRGDRGLPLHRTTAPTASAIPAKGSCGAIFTLDYSQTFPAPKPKRTYKGIQLDATKRFSNNWQGLASYLYSKLEGNFDGLYAPFTNVGADPNISAAYDYYDFFTNGSDLSKITNKGPLSNDRRHQLKLSGLYETPWKLSIGLSAYWRSGTPLTRYGYSDIYAPLRVLPHRARRRGADARQLRGGPPPRLSAHRRPGEGQPPARRLQPPERPAAGPARRALGLPGVGQRLPHSDQPELQEAGAANAAAIVPAGGAVEPVAALRRHRPPPRQPGHGGDQLGGIDRLGEVGLEAGVEGALRGPRRGRRR